MVAPVPPAACTPSTATPTSGNWPHIFQDTITVKNWTFNLGLRCDYYDGITSAKQAEPRLGIAYNIKPTNTVLRVSYARTLETPFNENLVLSSVGCNDPVVNALMASTISSLRDAPRR